MKKTQTIISASIAAAILVGAMVAPGSILNTALAVPNTSTPNSTDRGLGQQYGSVVKIIAVIDSPFGQETISSFKLFQTDNLMKAKGGFYTLRLFGPIMRDKTTLLAWVANDMGTLPDGLTVGTYPTGGNTGGNHPAVMTKTAAGATITTVPTRGKITLQLLDYSQDMYSTDSVRQYEFSGCHIAAYTSGTMYDDEKQFYRDGLQMFEEFDFACMDVKSMTSHYSEGNRGIEVETAINDDGRKIMNEKGELIITSREYRQPIVIEDAMKEKSVKQEIVTAIETDKVSYEIGDKAVFTVTFTDLEGNPISPDQIKAYYDGKTVLLEQQDTGVYTYATDGLTKASHQIVVSAVKSGFTTDTTYLSIPINRIS